MELLILFCIILKLTWIVYTQNIQNLNINYIVKEKRRESNECQYINSLLEKEKSYNCCNYIGVTCEDGYITHM